MSNELVVGSTNAQSTYEPWPNTWTWPNTFIPNTYVYPLTYSAPEEEYANEVEVEQGEHDATLRFYRKRNKLRTLVKEVTVPLSVLRWLQGEE